MKPDACISRRVAVATATLLLVGCTPDAPAVRGGSSPARVGADSAWTAELDPDAPILQVDGEGGSAVPGECWAELDDGSVQVQVAGSSIPAPAVEGVRFADGVLTLTMAVPDEGTPATMDYALSQFICRSKEEGRASVSAVAVVRGSERTELPAGTPVPSDSTE